MVLIEVYKNLTVKQKLTLYTAAFTAWFVVVTGAGIYSAMSIMTGLTEITEIQTRTIRLQETQKDILGLRLALVYGLASTTPEQFQKRTGAIDERIAKIRADIQHHKEAAEGKAKEDVEKLSSGFEAYASKGLVLWNMEKEVISKGSGSMGVSEFAATQVAPLYEPVAEHMKDIIARTDASSKKEFKEHTAEGKLSIMVTVALGTVAIILAGIFAWIITNSIVGPLGTIRGIMGKIASGDLTEQPSITTKEDFGSLASDMSNMINELRKMIRSLVSNSTALTEEAGRINSGTMQIATAVEEVAAQAATVATASEEMNATAADIASNCAGAANGAASVNDTSQKGAATMNATITQMQQISTQVSSIAASVADLGTKTDRIGAIVETIEDIAGQTNLLALNAAIEAARAGEQGRGFAVVADEVGNLAKRTSTATKEIGGMIRDIQTTTAAVVDGIKRGIEEVRHGVEEAAQSGQALSEIASLVEGLNGQISQIATAAEQQSATTGQIASNIQQVSSVTHDTAQGVQDIASVSHNLNRVAADLHAMVNRFKV